VYGGARNPNAIADPGVTPLSWTEVRLGARAQHPRHQPRALATRPEKLKPVGDWLLKLVVISVVVGLWL